MNYDDDTSRQPGFEILSPEEAWKEVHPKVTVNATKTKLIQDLRRAHPEWAPGQIAGRAYRDHNTTLTLAEVHTVVKAMR